MGANATIAGLGVRTSWVWICLVLVAGCGGEPASIATLRDLSLQQEGTRESLLSPGLVSRNSPIAFDPPFPERSDPFRRPEAESTATPAPIATADVRVMGFAKLDAQQAILRFGDQTRFMVEGDIFQNVEVVKITPPRVRLRYGNLMWDVSMFQSRGPN